MNCILCDMPTEIDGQPVGGMVVSIPCGKRDDDTEGRMAAHFDCLVEFNREHGPLGD